MEEKGLGETDESLEEGRLDKIEKAIGGKEVRRRTKRTVARKRGEVVEVESGI